ncbi:acyl-CoA thioesterase [Catenovulum maritimum]|uniref:Acyl-CoA thioester hydrolase n=1 Tax=Catenovulum maritimum TaxID=1513271 RepID=A0A0J8GUR1_9ALTE|nr:acyl-CoA thioesterase [Catenovulum maritimum]KMT66492.1 acyl-CoA thioester hydrolase [Catenovulum maritimum]
MGDLKPDGELILRTQAMPADTNANGDIFGGWIMAQMDIAGGMMAKAVAKSRTVTVAVDSIRFIQAVHVGDIFSCYGSVAHIGNTSLKIQLEVWVEPVLRTGLENKNSFKVCEGIFTYVAIDDNGQKHKVKRD